MIVSQYRFLKKNRLKTPGQFRSVFKSGKRSADSQFIVITKQNGLGYSRLGMAIPKHKVHLAVIRNSIKRHIRESFRQHAVTLNGHDVVVLPQKTINAKNSKVLKKSLVAHWKKIPH